MIDILAFETALVPQIELELNGPEWSWFLRSVPGYVYMNGDVGKLPSGAVYPAAPETGAAVPEYVAVNGVAEGAEGLSPSAAADGPHSSLPLSELKQMLSQQLEYYFSRQASKSLTCIRFIG